jgi:anti-sigma regulatory factor (Ser/Thr protein kinase)
MSAWWTLVGSNQTRTEIDVDNDPRLAAALRAVLEQAACRLELSDESLQKLQIAAQEAWQNVWRSFNGASQKLHLDCEEFPDRIELTFRCSGGSAAEIEAFASGLRAKVDQVSIETRSEKPELKLIKYARR